MVKVEATSAVRAGAEAKTRVTAVSMVATTAVVEVLGVEAAATVAASQVRLVDKLQEIKQSIQSRTRGIQPRDIVTCPHLEFVKNIGTMEKVQNGVWNPRHVSGKILQPNEGPANSTTKILTRNC